MANEQQKIALLSKTVNYAALKENRILMNYLQKALPAIPDSEILYAEKIIKEIQENCPHNGDKRLQPLISLNMLRFEEKCSLCGHVTRQDVPVTEL